MPSRLACWVVVVFLLTIVRPAVAADSGPDFIKEIQPIFAAACYDCHGASEQKSGYRLDNKQIAIAGGELGEAAIVPGKSAESPLMRYVAGEDEALRMPPKESGKPALQPEQVVLLKKWIDAGANWPESASVSIKDKFDHWAYRELVRPEAKAAAGQSPVDAFLSRKLTDQKLTPNPSAGRLALARRLTYDLTGLPPTPAEIDAFLQECYDAEPHNETLPPLTFANDPPPRTAYLGLVDRLLAAPAFGEKWAQHWLDLARYAETHGYDKDQPRNNAWPYRDYVIRAFHEDKPYGRFVQEQIAGDVLFTGEPDSIAALGFLAAGPWDLIGHIEVGEGKVDGRIAKHLDRDEMISAIYNVFLSTTVQCAQCHNHKFDPIKMEDYYRLHAVFADVDRAERVYKGLSAADEARRLALQQEIRKFTDEKNRLASAAKQRLEPKTKDIDKRLAELRQKFAGQPRPEYGYHSNIEKSQTVPKWVQVDLGSSLVVDQVKLMPAWDMFNNIGAGFGFPVKYKVEASSVEDFSKDVRTLKDATAEDQANPLTDEILIEVGGEPVRYIRVTATKLALRQNDYIFALAELEATAGGKKENVALRTKVTALDSIEAPVRWGKANLTDGIYHRELNDAAAQAELKELEARRAAIVAELRDEKEEKQLAEIEAELSKLTPQLQAIPAGEMIYAAATQFNPAGSFVPTQGRPRPIHLLKRGDIRNPGDKMEPGMPALWPAVVPQFAAESPRGILASQIGSKENPLVWRSMANRVWLWTFGQGLASSANDFGHMGGAPTHPELLDWLGCALRDDPKQSVKSLVRLLVTSEAYQRSSQINPANVAIDANNQMLWRAARRRLTSQELRDSLLSASGVLKLDNRGGPSFRDFVIQKPEHSPHYEYELFDPANAAAHRRTIYRFVVRSQPQPWLTTLGCADPSISVAEPEEPTTALQALAMWNNKFVEAMARQMARRLEAEPQLTSAQRIDLACRLILGRLPDDRECIVLQQHLDQHGAASLARVLFNSNAFVYVE